MHALTSPLDALEAATERVVALERPDRSTIVLGGSDVLRYLHAVCTQHTLDRAPGDATQALLLSPKGKIEFAFRLAVLEEGVLVDTEAAGARGPPGRRRRPGRGRAARPGARAGRDRRAGSGAAAHPGRGRPPRPGGAGGGRRAGAGRGQAGPGGGLGAAPGGARPAPGRPRADRRRAGRGGGAARLPRPPRQGLLPGPGDGGQGPQPGPGPAPPGRSPLRAVRRRPAGAPDRPGGRRRPPRRPAPQRGRPPPPGPDRPGLRPAGARRRPPGAGRQPGRDRRGVAVPLNPPTVCPPHATGVEGRGRRPPRRTGPPLPGRHRPGVAAPRVISWISSKDSSPVVSALLDLQVPARRGRVRRAPARRGLWTAWRAPFPESATLPLRGG